MIHSTAVIDARAQIDPSAEIGPYVVIDGPVVVGPGTSVHPHAVLLGDTTVGAGNVIHSGAVIGDVPQDLAFARTESAVRIGDRNVIREHVTIHRGTKAGSVTEIGDDNFFMNNAHVGHNCRIGNHAIIVSGALLAGYVEVADRVFVSGNCVVHQFVHIGRLALLRGLSRTSRDVPPFCIMDGTHTVRAINRVGLRRAGFGSEQIRDLHRAFVRLFRRRSNLRLACDEIAAQAPSAEVAELIDFIRGSRRGVCFGPRVSSAEPAEIE